MPEIPLIPARRIHASQHQHGGNDEIATATPGANAIPKAESDGKLASGWIDAADVVTHYNSQVSQVSGGEISAGTETGIRRYSPADIVAIVAAHESGGGSSLPVDDTTSLVRDPVDTTKQVRIDAGSVATGTVRVINMPDSDVTLQDVGPSASPTFTGLTTTGAVSVGGDLSVSRAQAAGSVLATLQNTDTTAGSIAQLNINAGTRQSVIQQSATGQLRIQAASASVQIATSVGNHILCANDNTTRLPAVASTPSGVSNVSSLYADSTGNPYFRVGTGRIIDIGALGLTATAVQTGNYTAAAGELVLVDPSSASADITITLPATAAPCAVMLVSNAAGRWNVLIGRNGNTVNDSTDTSRFAMRYSGQAAFFRPESSGYVGQRHVPPNNLNAYDFDGSSYYPIANSAAINITGAMSMSGWIYATGTGSQIIYGGYDSSSPFNGFGLSVGGGSGSDRLEIWDGTAWRAGSQPLRNRWRHFVVSHNGSSSVTIYIDGRRDAVVSANALSSYTGAKAIGATSAGASNYNGLLQDFKIHNVGLTAANAQYMFNNQRGWPVSDISGIVAWYLGNEGSGSTAVDLVSANNGTVSGTAAWSGGIIRL